MGLVTPVSDVVERVAAELREHGYGGATCTRDERKEYCQCGWSSTQHDHETHLGVVVVEALKPTTIDPEDLWDAHQYVLDWMDSDTCDDTPEHRERLKALAKRLKNASNAAALSTSPWVGVLSEQGSGQ